MVDINQIFNVSDIARGDGEHRQTFGAGFSETASANDDADAPLRAIEELKQHKQWVGWKYVIREGSSKPTKPPVNPHNGLGASHSKPLDWGSHKQAMMGMRRYGLMGVGFVLTDEDEYTGIDLDNCRDPDTEELEPWAEAAVALAETYTEVSPSGRGIRMFARGKVASATKCDPAGVEIYGSHRYMTVTEQHVEGTPLDIREAPQTLEMLLSRVEAMQPAREEPAATGAPHINTTPRPAASQGAGGGEFFRNVNDKALQLLGMWVPELCPGAKFQASTGAYRVSSKSLGRALQEDLSFHPEGIKDHGVADMGDANQGRRSPIDSVIEHGGAPDAIAAAKWLCERMNRTPGSLGWRDGAQHDDEAVRIGDEIAEGLIARAAAEAAERERVFADGDEIDPETGEIINEAPADDSTAGTEKAQASDAGQAAGGARAIEIIVAASLANKPVPKQEWLVEDLIPGRNVTLLSGDGGTGKSLLSLQLAAAVATGGSWLGYRPQAGRALFLSAEDEVDELHRRLARIEPRLERLTELLLLDLAGEDAILAAPQGRDRLILPTRLFKAVQRAVATYQPMLIVLDTAADLFAGNENARTEVRTFISQLRKVCLKQGVTIVLLSHPSQTGLATGSGSSGSTSWNNSVRSRLYFSRRIIDKIEDDPDLRVLEQMKSNRSRVGGQIVVRWKKGRFEREVESSLSVHDAAAKAAEVFLALLTLYLAQERTVSDKPGPNYAPSLFAKHPDAEGVTKNQFGKAMERLFRDKRIAIEEVGPISRRQRKIVLTGAAHSASYETCDEELEQSDERGADDG